MNVSPLDLRQQRFRKSFRGFDRVEVAAFLSAIADDYEQALRETDRLHQELTRAEAMLSEHRSHEKNLQSTMTTAQKLSDDIKANAEKEAVRILHDAEMRSDLLLDKTQARLEDIQREIDGLKLKRKDVETSIEANISTLRNTLEFVREQEARERDDKILIHRPRHAEPLDNVDTHQTRRMQSSGLSSWGTALIRETAGGVELDVRVIPRARKTECSGVRDQALLIRVAAPPVEGAANEALIAFFSATLRVPRHAVQVVSGEHARRKRIAIAGVSAEDVMRRVGLRIKNSESGI